MKEKNQGPRITFERKTVQAMIEIYYRQFKDETSREEKEEVMEYAMQRLDFCCFGEEKPTCKVCPVHCYKKSYRLKMQKIMCYSGPRMLLYHPWMSFQHMFKEKRYQRKIDN